MTRARVLLAKGVSAGALGSWLSEREQRLVAGAETASAATPIPTQIVSNGEFLPPKQSEMQRRVERRIFEGRGKRQATWLEQTAVHADELRHGRGVRRYERGLWRERVPSCSGRGARTRIDARASPDPVGPVHLRCPDPFHP